MKMTRDEVIKEFGASYSYEGHMLIFSFAKQKETSAVMKFLREYNSCSLRVSRELPVNFLTRENSANSNQFNYLDDLIVNCFDMNEGERNKKLRDIVEDVLLDHLVGIHKVSAGESFLRVAMGSPPPSEEVIRNEYKQKPEVRKFIASLECKIEKDIDDEINISGAVLNIGDNVYQTPETFLSYTGVCTVPYQVTERLIFEKDGCYKIKYKAKHKAFDDEDNPAVIQFSTNNDCEIIPDLENSNFSKRVGHGDFFLSQSDALAKADFIADRLGEHLEKWKRYKQALIVQKRAPA